MKKLKSIIQYECASSIKYIFIFYICQYAIVALIFALAAIYTGSLDEVGTNCLEMNTIIFVGIVGILGFKEDFKMLIQNGFTRRYIFLSAVSLFAFISGIMSFVDTVAGNVMHHFFGKYSTILGDIYGYKYIPANWLILFFIYMFVCTLLYLGVIIINKIGKTISIYLGIILGGSILLIIALFKYVVPDAFILSLAEAAGKAMGFMSNGAINFFFPVLTLFVFVGGLSICSYLVLRRTELK